MDFLMLSAAIAQIKLFEQVMVERVNRRDYCLPLGLHCQSFTIRFIQTNYLKMIG